MKKNKMMRLASSLLVAVLLTSSVISGTFAKYVTTNGGSDTVRVAKFGVKIEVSDDLGLFSKTYAKDSSTEDVTIVNTVIADTEVVAPGTKGNMKFRISGTPEVATRLTVDFTSTSTIHLVEGTYTLTEGFFAADDETVTIPAGEVYEPIKFYFGTKAHDTLEDSDYNLTLGELKTEINNLEDEYAAGYTFDQDYTLAWWWPFEGEFTVGSENVADFLDTYLGNQNPAQTEAFEIAITVTQID